MNKYIEIIRDSDNEVVKRIDVTEKEERYIDKVIDGMTFNLNHDLYSISLDETEDIKPIIE